MLVLSENGRFQKKSGFGVVVVIRETSLLDIMANMHFGVGARSKESSLLGEPDCLQRFHVWRVVQWIQERPREEYDDIRVETTLALRALGIKFDHGREQWLRGQIYCMCLALEETTEWQVKSSCASFIFQTWAL